MTLLCVFIFILGLAIGVPATWLSRALGRKLSALDGVGVPGQVKLAPRKVPNTGGLGIALPLIACILAGLAGVHWFASQITSFLPELAVHIPGIRSQTVPALIFVACVLVLHIVGLIDDRRPLGASLKLFIMLIVTGVCVWFTDSRLLTLLDSHVSGPWLSVVLTVLWIVVVTNAFNFLDNMDGLSAGVGALCAMSLLVIAIMSPVPQWFIAAVLALLAGVLAGFLVFNFPFNKRRKLADGSTTGGASIFMGDSGSLVVGFVLALMSVRITYATIGSSSSQPVPASVLAPVFAPWFATLTPLIVLAIPLYDFSSVCCIRLSQGKSPFVGDLQHFSHRLVNHGLSPRWAVLVIYGCTIITGISAITLARLEGWQAVLVGIQTLATLGVIAIYEWARTPASPGSSTSTSGGVHEL